MEKTETFDPDQKEETLLEEYTQKLRQSEANLSIVRLGFCIRVFARFHLGMS